jgi:hypothetical protein
MTRIAAILFVISTVLAFQNELKPGNYVLWTDPGEVRSLDFTYGVGGPEKQPQPPFRFVEEDISATSPKVTVTDASGATWSVKWGREARPSVFCSRLLWASGYFVQPEYFVANGRVEGARGLTRADQFISGVVSFKNARFQLRADSPKFLSDEHWTLAENPFVDSRELQGLKILSLLVSNWDTKKPNLSIFRDDTAGETRYLYAQVDWGSTLGRWGGYFSRSKSDCKGFASETSDFLRRDDKDLSLKWGFHGKSRDDIIPGITVNDIRWILQYLGEISDEQIHEGLIASGHSDEDVTCYATALRQRIQQLQKVAADPSY